MNSHLAADTLLWDHYQVNLREAFAQAQPRFDYLVKLIKECKPRGLAMDIGLGDGYLLEQLALSGYICSGIDIAKDSLESNRQRFAKKQLSVDLKYGNINQIPYQNSTFDVVTASEVLEHLTTEDLHGGIKEVFRILKPGGLFVMTVPADEILADYMMFCPHCGQSFHRWGHKQSYSQDQLNELFKNFKLLFLKKTLIQASGLNMFGLAAYLVNLAQLRMGKKIRQAKYFVIAQKPI